MSSDAMAANPTLMSDQTTDSMSYRECIPGFIDFVVDGLGLAHELYKDSDYEVIHGQAKHPIEDPAGDPHRQCRRSGTLT